MKLDPEARTAAVVALARAGVQTDIQELLIAGDPMRGIPPGALDAALLAYAASLPQSQDIRALVERLFEDLRDRRLLKWLFSEEPTVILHDSHGDPLNSIDLDVQEEIKAAWCKIIAADALSCLAGEGWRPKVKPLVWEDRGLGIAYAETPFCTYKVNLDGYWWRDKGSMQGANGKPECQTDFDRRILSALDLPAPSVEEKLP